MTFKEIVEKGEAKIYIVKKNSPINVTEIDCIAVTKQTAKERNYFYFGWYEDRQNFQFILARKSKNKRMVRRDGAPSVVSINCMLSYAPLTLQDLDNTRLQRYNYIIFANKDDACDYVIDKIKRKKLELNSYILKVNKLKFETV